MQEASGTSGPQPRTIAAPQTGVASLHLIWSRLSGLKKRRKGVALGLWGEAGIGKTHTALELLRGLSCRSLSLLASTPLTDLAGRLPRPPRLSAWAARMMDRAGAGEQTGSIDLLNAVTTTLGELAPFVLHLEDLHDAGTEQAELIGLLARTIQRTPGVGLLVTSRLQLPEGFESRRHAPLDPLGAARLLEEEAGAALPPEALSWIFVRASGNPLFSLEYFRLLARLGHLWNDARLWRWREPPATLMPVTVEALIERTLHDVLGQGDPAAGPLGDVAGAWASRLASLAVRPPALAASAARSVSLMASAGSSSASRTKPAAASGSCSSATTARLASVRCRSRLIFPSTISRYSGCTNSR